MPNIHEVLDAFSQAEYGDTPDYSDPSCVHILYTTVYDSELFYEDNNVVENFDLQIDVDLINPAIVYSFDCWGVVDRANHVYREKFPSLEDLARNLEYISFNDLYGFALGTYGWEVD